LRLLMRTLAVSRTGGGARAYVAFLNWNFSHFIFSEDGLL